MGQRTVGKQAGSMENMDGNDKKFYLAAGIAALFALAGTILDVLLGFGVTEVLAFGSKTAVEWFSIFQEDWFNGFYTLGFLNIVYMVCMVPVYLGLYFAHRHRDRSFAALALAAFFVGMAVYLSNNAAIPMLVLSGKYASAASDAQRSLLAAAGEAVLARGEDFTPGSFIGLIFGSLAAFSISMVMLRGGVFDRWTARIGVTGFLFLTVFTVWATFIPVYYQFAYYVFGMLGGLLALTWFVRVALGFFRLARSGS